MASSTSILADKLHEYPQQNVLDGGTASVLDACLNKHDGVLQLVHRYAGRTFCTPGKRLRLDAASYYPEYMNGTGLDELWMGCTVPIVTGVIDTRTQRAPFREGESHVLTADGQLISLQDLIVADSTAVMGEKITTLSKSLLGKVTWPIVSKKFDNLNPIPDHLHWTKWEVYDINSYDNPACSNFGMVALVHPGHLRLSISTSNASPALASRLRKDLEGLFDEQFVDYLDLLAQARQRVRERVEDRETRFELLRALVREFRLEGQLCYPAEWRRHAEALLRCELEACGTQGRCADCPLFTSLP